MAGTDNTTANVQTDLAGTTLPAPLDILGPPPLLEGEDGALYDELLARISASVEPEDVLEEIWVRDVVDLVWETFRLRRLKAAYLDTAAYEGLHRLLEAPLGHTAAGVLARQWACRESTALTEVERHLTAMGLTMEAIRAMTIALKLAELERIDRMIMGAESRRNAILREVDRHRDVLAISLRQAVKSADEANIEDLTPTVVSE